MSWMLLNCHKLYLNCMQDDISLSEMSTGWSDSYWAAYWLSWMLLNCHRLWLICMQGNFALSEQSIEWLESYWTVYWLSWILLNCHRLWLICMHSDFTLSEQSIEWLELYTGCLECCWTVTSSSWTIIMQVWFCSCWIVYWLTWLQLNLVIWLQLSCLLGDSSIRVFWWMHQQDDCSIRVSRSCIFCMWLSFVTDL